MNNIINPFTQNFNGKLRTLSISELSLCIKDILETTLNRVRVRGEVIGLKKSPSGHYYFDLKEKINNTDYVINAIIWKWTVLSINTPVENGQIVIIEGKLSSYSGRSSYNIIVDNIEAEGIGTLLKEIEDRRVRLQKNGVFAIEHKKKIPYLPKIIGVITSESGAVIRDILHRLSDRFPVNVLLQSVSVQGETSKTEIIQAIKNFDNVIDDKNNKPDVIIIARGGGSLQDLMIFNDEDIVMSIYNCSIPIISAIGHETDYTLVDYVADLRAPTPTAAAELAVPVLSDLLSNLKEKYQNLYSIIKIKLDNLESKLKDKNQALKSPKQIINDLNIRLDDKVQVLDLNIKNLIKLYSEKIKSISQMIEQLSFKNVLKRGYSIIWDDQNHIISNSRQLMNSSNFNIEFADNKIKIEKKNFNIQDRSIMDTSNKNRLSIKEEQGNLF